MIFVDFAKENSQKRPNSIHSLINLITKVRKILKSYRVALAVGSPNKNLHPLVITLDRIISFA